jgi:hypothetical protein
MNRTAETFIVVLICVVWTALMPVHIVLSAPISLTALIMACMYIWHEQPRGSDGKFRPK